MDVGSTLQRGNSPRIVAPSHPLPVFVPIRASRKTTAVYDGGSLVLIKANVVLLGGHNTRDVLRKSGITVDGQSVRDIKGCCFRASEVQQPRSDRNEGRHKHKLKPKVDNMDLDDSRIPIGWKEAVRRTGRMVWVDSHGKVIVAIG